MVRNIQDYDYYLDIYEDVNITISSSSNETGFVNTDDNGNMIGSFVHSGSIFITSGTKTISGNMIIYDDINFKYIDGNFSTSIIDKHFLVKPSHQVRYLINVLKETPTVSGNDLVLDLTAKQVFKVYINGTEATSYTYTASGITLTGNDVNLLTGINDYIKVYTYGNQTISAGSLILTYKVASELLPTLTDLQDDSAFSSMTSICDFEDFSPTTNKTLNTINNLYEYINEDEEVNRNCKLTITMFEDIRETIKDKRFRLLAWDRKEEELIIYSNMIWQDGENKSVKRGRNEINYSFNYEDEIIITYPDGTRAYGVGNYGEGYCGGYKAFNPRV